MSCWLVIVVLASWRCSLLHCAVASGAALTVVSLGSGDLEVRSIIEVAQGFINNSSSILPGYNLQVVSREEWCGFPPAPGLDSFPVAGELWGARHKNFSTLVGIIGPTCSSSAVFLGSLLAREESWPINIHMAESHMLEDRKKYPKSFGIAGSLSKLYRACIELIRINNWTRVSVLYDESHLYHSSTLYEIDGSLRDNHAIVEHFVSNSNPLTYIPLDEIKKESRIIFLFLREDLARKVLCFAFHLNVTYPAYQFILVTNDECSTVANSSRKQRSFFCPSDDIAMAIFGAVCVSLDNQYVLLSNHSFWNGLEEELNLELDIRQGAIKEKTWLYLDALQSIVLALNSSLAEWNGSTQFPSQAVTNGLQKLDFNGFSGPIRFSKAAGFVDREVLIKQVLRDEIFLIATYGRGAKLEMTQRKGTFVPSEIKVVEEVTPYSPPLSQSLAYMIFFATFMITVMLVVSHVLTCRYRHTKEVKASSWKVQQLAFLGCYLLELSIIAHTLLVAFFRTDVKTRCWLWHPIFGSLSVGFTLIEGTMCVLTWRLYRIFVAFKNPGKCLSNRALVLVVALCIFITLSISVTWWFLDPLQPVVNPNSFQSNLEITYENSTVSGVAITKTKFMYCASKVSSIIWTTLLFALTFPLSILTCVFVYLTRKVPMKQFRATRLIRLNYILIGSGFLFVYVYAILNLDRSPEPVFIRFIMYAVVLNFIDVIICGLLFCPPLYNVLIRQS